jgi:hypothetical protein
MKIPPQVEQDLIKFLESGQPGSITFHSDGRTFRQAEVKTIRRYDGGTEKEKEAR